MAESDEQQLERLRHELRSAGAANAPLVQISQQAQRAARQATAVARERSKTVENWVRQQPFLALSLAVVLGFGLSRVL